MFSLASYHETYSTVNLLPVDTSELPETASGKGGPPLLKKPRGRPKEKRLRKGERRREYLKAKAARAAGQAGQAAIAAGELPAELPASGRPPQRCSQSRGVGHNRTTCVEVMQFPIVGPSL